MLDRAWALGGHIEHGIASYQRSRELLVEGLVDLRSRWRLNWQIVQQLVDQACLAHILLYLILIYLIYQVSKGWPIVGILFLLLPL